MYSIQVKLMYILHWMLFDSASECLDAMATTTAGAASSASVANAIVKSPKDSTTSQGLSTAALSPLANYLFPLSCVQIFVYLLAPLIHTLSDADFENIRLEGGLPLWQALWQFKQPDLL